MRDFGEIVALAAERKGGMPVLENALAGPPRSTQPSSPRSSTIASLLR
jgi:hypothetical protein